MTNRMIKKGKEHFHWALCLLLSVALLIFMAGVGQASPATEITWERVYGGIVDDVYLSGCYLPGMDDTKPAFADIDGDGDYDLFVGQGMDDPWGGTITYFQNVGTREFSSWAKPVENYNSVNTGDFSAPAFVDIDADGDLDLFVGIGTVSPPHGILFYENTGARYDPSWAAPVELSLSSIMIQAPAFVDIDSDEDYDLFVGEMDGTLTFYENSGTSTTAVWTAPVTNYNSINVSYMCSPAFVDIDNDGDFDLFVGGSDGTITFYENIGTALAPIWAAAVVNYGSFDVGGLSAPAFVDIDGDGDLDLFIGNGKGHIVWVENEGNKTSPGWTLACEHYPSISAGDYSPPTLVDYDYDGDLDLFLAEYPNVSLYENKGSCIYPRWSLPRTDYTPIDLGYTDRPAFVDIDNDADLDILARKYDGIIYLFENTGTPKFPSWAAPVEILDVGTRSNLDLADIDGDGDFDLFIGNYDGTITFYENIGTPSSPSWAAPVDNYNGINIGNANSSKPILVDIDGDGDIDLFVVGNPPGLFWLYENIGSPTSPVWAPLFDGYGFLMTLGIGNYPAFGDMDDDGDPDIFVMTNFGGLSFWRNMLPKITVVPSLKTVTPGEAIDFATSGTVAGGVTWSLIRDRSGGIIDPSTGHYVSGVITGVIDTIQATSLTTPTLIGRAHVNVISTADVEEAGKAIIVAGIDSISTDTLWPVTNYLCNLVYEKLRYRGFSSDNIRYLSADLGQPGVDELATLASIEDSVTSWSVGSQNLVMFLIGHGGDNAGAGCYRVNETELLQASTLDGWLDTLQTNYPCTVTVMVDASRSGSFIDELIPPAGQVRVTIASTTPWQDAYFASDGEISFTHDFIHWIYSGFSVGNSFLYCAASLGRYEMPMMDDNGDGIYDRDVDGVIADVVWLGPKFIIGPEPPQVANIASNQVIVGQTSAELWASDVSSVEPVWRMWAGIVPPSIQKGGTEQPVLNIPKLDLVWNSSLERYEGIYSSFTEEGAYKVVYYAEDVRGNLSFPKQSYVHTTIPEITPTPTATPTPTPTPSPTPWQIGFDFIPDRDDWTTGGAPVVFTPPDFVWEADYLKMTSSTNTNTFGFWQSLQDAIPADADYLYRARFRVSTNITVKSLVPQIRLRANSLNLQQYDVLSIESAGDGGASPAAAGTDYDLYFVPPANDTAAMLAFDLLNFNPDDAAVAELSLDTVTVDRFALSLLPAATVVQDYDFELSQDGWTTGGAPIIFSPPQYIHSAGALELRAITNTNTFGFWGNHPADITIEANKLYQGTFEVRTDVTNPALVPEMRLRFNTGNLQASRTLGIVSIGDGANSPAVTNTTYDRLYFLPPANCVGEDLLVSFDIFNFSPDDAPDASLILDLAIIETLSPPDLP